MRKSQKRRKAAAEQAAAAAEHGQKSLKEGLAWLQVLLEDGLDRVQDSVSKAQKQASPALKDARRKSADFAARKLDQAEPFVRGALDKVTPAVEAARFKVADDYLPRLSKALHDAAETPEKLAEVIKPEKKRSGWKTFGKVVALAAIVAGAVAAVRHFLSPKDDGWTAHEPSRAYVNNNDTFAAAAKVADEASDTDVEEDAAAAEASVAEAADIGAGEAGGDAQPFDVTETDASADMVAEGGPVADSKDYGEGSFVGDTPPEGFTIKGNERSMKYHVPGTGGYERTIAEVWFSSEEAAEAAGFTRAQR